MSIVTQPYSESKQRKRELKYLHDLAFISAKMVQTPLKYSKQDFIKIHEDVTNCIYNVYNLLKMKCDRYSIDNFKVLSKLGSVEEVKAFLEPFGSFVYKQYYIEWYKLKAVQSKLTSQINTYKTVDIRLEGFRSILNRVRHIQNNINTDEYTKNFIIDLNKFLMQIESQI